MSRLISAIAESWSGVSSNSKASSNSCWKLVSDENANPGAVFRAAYKDKYYYMGESDLLSASFLLDTAHYYIFVVIPAYRLMKKFYWMPVLGPKPAFFSYHLIKFYNRRFKAIAMARRAAGEAGARNDGRRISAYFNLSLAPMRMGLRGLKLWLFAELDGVLVSFRAALRLRSGQASTARNPVQKDAARSEAGDPSLRSG